MKTRAMTNALSVAAKASTKRKLVSSPVAEYQIAYLQLRSRTLMMTMAPRISRSRVKSSIRGEISRCESNASCDVGGGSESAAFCSGFGRRESFMRETTPSSTYRRDEAYDLESTVERRSSPRSTVVTKPSDAEIEEFFAAAERKETQRFAAKYNYDVVNDVPLDHGKYDWIQIAAPRMRK